MQISELEKARQEYYIKYPELIKSFGEWENCYFCASCGGELAPNMGCMKNYKDGYVNGGPGYINNISPREVSCPHCFCNRITKTVRNRNLNVYDSSPIDFKLIRRRKAFFKKYNWWKKLWGYKDDYFWEYKEV